MFPRKLTAAPKNIFLLAMVCLTAVLPARASAARTSNSWTVRWEPLRPVNGSPILFTVKSPVSLETLSGKWIGHDLFFFAGPRTNTWFAIAGVSLETVPGKYSLALSGKTADEKDVLFNRQIVIGKGKYRRIAVSVPRQFTEPNPEQLLEIKEEQELKKDLFSRTNPKREWRGHFVPPVAASISDVFGTARVFNGETQSIHQGLDYAVPSGTPVAALNRGTVLLSRPLFFEGNCVVLDHGQGLLSLYMHLSKLEVKEGDQVAKGQEIALSGGTGRATGPHLHIAVRWQGIYLNPATLLGLKLP